MIKIDIFSGFLGAGKTTLIKKLIKEAYGGEKLVLIENEFGEIGIDGGFMQDAGIEITEMNSGCICCSLVGDFGVALEKVIKEYSPDRILIEPSGVGKLSDVIRAVKDIDSDEIKLNSFTTVVDANKCRMYMKNFGEFFNNQVEHASTIVMSHTSGLSDEKIAKAVALLREHNSECEIVTTPWEQITGAQILSAIEHTETLKDELEHLAKESAHHHEHHHHHHDHDHDHDCDCGCEHEHHHHHDHECCEHEHHHHHHDHECCEHEHHHHHDHECCEHEHHHHDHDHDHDCDCGCGHDHHHHHADEVFTSWGAETPKKFTAEFISNALEALMDEGKYGFILRAKGIVAAEDGSWIHFDYVPGEPDVRSGAASTIGRLCIIGSKINEENIRNLFEV